jgi:hypothetical protein
MGDILLITDGDNLLNHIIKWGKILFTIVLYFVNSILHYVLMYNKPLYLIVIVSSRIKSLHYDLRYVPLITTYPL